MSATGGLPSPMLLAVVEHRGLVLLPLADHDDAVHRDRIEDKAHRVDRSLVSGDLVAAADPAGGSKGGGLGDTHELEGQIAVGLGRGGALHRPAGIRNVVRLLHSTGAKGAPDGVVAQ